MDSKSSILVSLLLYSGSTGSTTNMYIIFATVIGLHGAVASNDWSYSGEHGPIHWPGLCATGKRQSPVDISTEESAKTDLDPLNFMVYDSAFSGKVTNNGHSVQLELYGAPIHLEGADLPSTYIFEQMHFHWPAEHTLDKNRDALELHFVHYNDRYDNISYASQQGNGIAVLATLFELRAEDNLEMMPILKATEPIANGVGKSATLAGSKIRPYRFLPKHKSYYRYDGSLTTPGCQESVMWFIFAEKLSLSEKQLNVFKGISSHNGTLSFNYRPIQALGERKVYYRSDEYSSASTRNKCILLYTCTSFLLSRLSSWN